MDVIFLVARILLALVFLLPGIQVHLIERREAVALARSSGAPLPELMVPLAGVVIVTGSLLVAFGVWADLGSLLLAAFSVGVAPIMHAFWRESDPAAAQNQFAHFAKNIGLAAAALLVLAMYDDAGSDAPLSVGEPLILT